MKVSLARVKVILFCMPVLASFFGASAFAQVLTGTITGRALDSSGALLPGVAVNIASPAMIGGPRASLTDEQGSYRFSLLPAPGVYRVTFMLPGFQTLNIDDVNVLVGATMTINGELAVGGQTDEVTVTSEVPTINLETATVNVSLGSQLLDKLPYQRDRKGLGALIPGLYQTEFDVGGSSMGNGAGTSTRTHGRTGGDQTTVDGVFFSTLFGGYGSYEEVQVSAASKGAETYNPGAAINLVIKSGGNQFHGGGFLAWQDNAFQSRNVNQRLIDLGFPKASSNQMTRYNDVQFELGGPILRDKLWFYASYSDTYSGQLIPGFVDLKTGAPATFFIRVNGPTLKLTYKLTDKMNLETVAQFSRKLHPHWHGSEYAPLEATQNQWFFGGIGPKLKWTYIPTSKMAVEAEVARGGYWWPSTPWSTDVRRVNLTTGHTRGAWGPQDYVHPQRWNWTGSWSLFTDIAGKNNEIKTGTLGWWDKGMRHNTGFVNQQVYRYRSVAGDTDLFLRPNSVQVFDYPNFTADAHNYSSWYINDKITWNRHLTLNVGLRFDRTSSYLPEQGNVGSGPFATALVYPERHDFPIYNSWVPRFSMVYDVTGNGRLALKAGYGRYTVAGPLAGSVNPAAATTWTYSNWNGVIPYVPRLQDLASVSGGGAGSIRRLDPNLDNGYMDEYTAGVDLGLGRNYTVRFNVIRKADYGGSKTLDLAQPFEAYTDVRYATDPGRDNVVGTADDGVMQTWSVPRSYPGFGKIDQLITNREDGEGNSLYTAYDTTLNKQFSNGWSMMVSYAATFAKQGTVNPTNPNQLVYNWKLPEWYNIVRMNGTYELPWGVRYATTYSAQSGEYFPRQALMPNALNSTVTVTVEGQAGRYDWVKMWDNRLSKTFQVAEGHSIEAMFDLYNTLNTSVVIKQVNQNGPEYLRPYAGSTTSAVPMAIIPPRVFRLGMRWKF